MTPSSPTIGIIGGFGPETSAAFCRRLIAQAHAIRSDIPPGFLVDFVAVPHLLAKESMNGSEISGVKLVKLINACIDRLHRAGATVIAFPCNTMHSFADRFVLPASVTFLHIVDVVVQELQRTNVDSIGLLGTSLTLSSRLYQDRCKTAGIECHVPLPERQRELTGLIAHFVEHGDVAPETAEVFRSVLEHFAAAGVSTIVLGCTDLSGMMEMCDIVSPLPLLDSFELLAQRCAEHAL